MRNHRTNETSPQPIYELGLTLHFLAHMLEELRFKHRLNQSELAPLLGISQSHVSKLENGLLDVQLSTLLKIATVFNVAPKELLPNKAELENVAWNVGGWGIKREGAGLLKKKKSRSSDSQRARPAKL